MRHAFKLNNYLNTCERKIDHSIPLYFRTCLASEVCLLAFQSLMLLTKLEKITESTFSQTFGVCTALPESQFDAFKTVKVDD